MRRKMMMLLGIVLSLTFCLGCVKKTEYDDKEIQSILYYSMDGWSKKSNYKLYDFQDLTYSEKAWESWEYTLKTTFTQEKATQFFDNIQKHGIFLLEKTYKTDEVIDDGGTSFLVITFSDETTFSSSFYHKFPKQAKRLNQDFMTLSGFNLFNY